MMNHDLLKWGILGCGRIAGTFCRSMTAVADGTVTACASRTPGKASAFAAGHGIGFHGNYEELLARDEVEAVYVATTHNFHHDHVLQCLRAGKHVLCEKPLAVTRAEAEEMAACARERGLFLMEAMWTRFLPSHRRIGTWLREGAIGQVRTLRASFCFRADFDPASRLFDPALAGGALLDVGIYPVAFASFVMQGASPVEIRAVADIGSTGVDEQTACVFRYADGALALLSCGVRSPAEGRAEICGTEGRIVLPGHFHDSQVAEVHRTGREPEMFRDPFPEQEGFRFEIEAAQRAIRNGELECGEMSVGESVAIAGTMDRIREAAGGG